MLHIQKRGPTSGGPFTIEVLGPLTEHPIDLVHYTCLRVLYIAVRT